MVRGSRLRRDIGKYGIICHVTTTVPDTLPRILEFAMLFCFGFSWPFAIAKTVRAKRVDGKSPLFEIIVIVGYLFGIASHLISDRSWVIWVYLADTALVATDLALYFHYARRSRRSATLPFLLWGAELRNRKSQQ